NFPKNDEDRSGSGIGLDNLRKRLTLIYPDCHILKEENDGKYHTSLLVINL
ncbi:MAG: sensor histidine kinase, partial [Bacteroidia bacterium]|nr:sensor histidine kinase [Bacteroidia bacterium]